MDSRDGVEQLDIELEKDRALSHSTLSFPCLAIHNISTRPKGGDSVLASLILKVTKVMRARVLLEKI